MPKYKKIKEGLATIQVPTETKISKDLPVFYNPVMKFNRDASVLFIKSMERDDIKVALPLAGTGIRGIRFLLETEDKISELHFNDAKAEAVRIIQENLDLNLGDEGASRLKDKRITFSQREASKFLLDNKGFDYIDVDPFGTPNPFLDAAIKRMSRNGILAITATDTSALCGAFINACRRKYWATPRNDAIMHETGLRILIRKAQLIAAQYERSLTPLLSYSKDHYMRVFFLCEKGKRRTDEVLRQQGMLDDVGPMWLGRLSDEKTLKAIMRSISKDDLYADIKDFFTLLYDESKVPFCDIPGFFDVHATSKRIKTRHVPKFETIIGSIKDRKYKAIRTHFSQYGIKTDMPRDMFEEILAKLGS